MTMLSAPRLHQIIDQRIITCEDVENLHKNVNSASIDVRIGNRILIERGWDKAGDGKEIIWDDPVDLEAKETLHFYEVEIPREGFIVEPGECFLAATMETFNLPDTISCRFDLRSSIGRNFLEH
ncbi:MAG: 2'-deoxycytidine 5'-triphosphate deaminase domain-containing protein, partial [Bacteroidales bacterium]